LLSNGIITMKSKILLLSLLPCFFIPGYMNYSKQGESLNSSADKNRRARLSEFLDKKKEEGQYFTLVFEQGDSIHWAESNGYALRNHKKIDSETVFDIASYTKVFTAVAVMQLAEKGKLKFDDPISKYFQKVPFDKKNITIHQLLTHSSGLQAFHDRRGDFQKMSKAEAIREILKKPIEPISGNDFRYSNSGYTLLALIIEWVSEMTYPDFVRKNILIPFELRRTGFYGDFAGDNNVAIGYGNKKHKGNHPSNWEPATGALLGAGGVISSASDMLRFFRLLNEGVLLKEDAYERFTSSYLVNSRYDGIFSNKVMQAYAVNIREDKLLGKTILAGGTSDYGFVNRIIYYKDKSAYLLIVTNNFNSKIMSPIISNSSIRSIENILFGD
jgi:CubicO group peptidase (beta-lactamase class C family)